MQNPFRRWFGAPPSVASDAIRDVREWAATQGLRFATSKGAEGFVVEPGAGGWRLEWGPSQRGYIEGFELRLRSDIGEAGDLQMLLASRELVTLLEREVYEKFTEGAQTRIDDQTPEEMRWLVLYPKMPRSALPSFPDRFVVLANRPAAAPMWVEGALLQRLRGEQSWPDDAAPFVMVVQRGRFVLRTALAQPDPATLETAIALGAAAAAAARHVGAEVARGAIGSERPSTWGAPSAMPAPDPDAPR
ncbi:MAG: hypothetical protein OEW27_06100 [Aquincola sp.]|nr:hypothetical protein [Aquincola sp.]